MKDKDFKLLSFVSFIMRNLIRKKSFLIKKSYFIFLHNDDSSNGDFFFKIIHKVTNFYFF